MFNCLIGSTISLRTPGSKREGEKGSILGFAHRLANEAVKATAAEIRTIPAAFIAMPTSICTLPLRSRPVALGEAVPLWFCSGKLDDGINRGSLRTSSIGWEGQTVSVSNLALPISQLFIGLCFCIHRRVGHWAGANSKNAPLAVPTRLLPPPSHPVQTTTGGRHYQLSYLARISHWSEAEVGMASAK